MRATPLILAVALSACAVPPVTTAPSLQPIAVADGVASNMLRLDRVVTRLVAGARVGIQYGWMCISAPDQRLPPVRSADLSQGFRRTLEGLQYRVEKASESVFESVAEDPATLLIGATVFNIQANVCHPFTGSPFLNVGDPSKVKGKVFTEVRWEIYSVLEARVVHTVNTQGYAEANEIVSGGAAALYLDAFVANLRNLAADRRFHEIALSDAFRPKKPESPPRPST